ncbi:hypothetical protein MMC27_001040 [Xylographa pallens]|nr:hypothetical protein [Xylographa pallens]
MDPYRTNPSFSVLFNAYHMHEGAAEPGLIEQQDEYHCLAPLCGYTHHDIHVLNQHVGTHFAPAAPTFPASSPAAGFGNRNPLDPYAWQNTFDATPLSSFLTPSTGFATAYSTAAVPLAYGGPPFNSDTTLRNAAPAHYGVSAPIFAPPLTSPPPSTNPAAPPTPATPNTRVPPPDKRVLCATCGKKYARYTDMVRHAAAHDEKAKKYECWAPGCPYHGARGFTRKDKLVAHQRGRHGLR